MASIADLESRIEDLEREVTALKRRLPKRRPMTAEEAITRALAEAATAKKIPHL